MATRKSNPPVAPNGKVRFIMLEADINPDSLGQLAEAITAALRPAAIQAPSRRVLTVPAGVIDSPEDLEQSDEADEEDAQQGEVTTSGKANRPPRKYKYPAPKVIDVDLDSPLSFQEYAEEKAPSQTGKKYLVVAAWFKEQRNVDAVTADHVYTCFKKVGWSTAIKNFPQPLYDISHNDWGAMSKGAFSINHIGLDVVRKMNASK